MEIHISVKKLPDHMNQSPLSSQALFMLTLGSFVTLLCCQRFPSCAHDGIFSHFMNPIKTRSGQQLFGSITFTIVFWCQLCTHWLIRVPMSKKAKTSRITSSIILHCNTLGQEIWKYHTCLEHFCL